MNLTGNVYQDYTSLKKLYDQSGKILLTGNTDVDYQILSQLNIKDLGKVCISNKYTNQLCNNKNFWKYKLKSEELDVIQLKASSVAVYIAIYNSEKSSIIYKNGINCI